MYLYANQHVLVGGRSAGEADKEVGSQDQILYGCMGLPIYPYILACIGI